MDDKDLSIKFKFLSKNQIINEYPFDMILVIDSEDVSYVYYFDNRQPLIEQNNNLLELSKYWETKPTWTIHFVRITKYAEHVGFLEGVENKNKKF